MSCHIIIKSINLKRVQEIVINIERASGELYNIFFDEFNKSLNHVTMNVKYFFIP